jgi:hypothetical protein
MNGFGSFGILILMRNSPRFWNSSGAKHVPTIPDLSDRYEGSGDQEYRGGDDQNRLSPPVHCWDCTASRRTIVRWISERSGSLECSGVGYGSFGTEAKIARHSLAT